MAASDTSGRLLPIPALLLVLGSILLPPSVFAQTSTASPTSAVMTRSAVTGPCDVPIQNPVACENSKPGSPPTEWDVPLESAPVFHFGDWSIVGFATPFSVNHGEPVTFKIKTTAQVYRVDIYRLGYYGGLGARRVATLTGSRQIQPACVRDANTGLVDCGTWLPSVVWHVPSDAVSGVYIARAVRTDTNGASHIPFVVRDDEGHSDLLFQTSDTTWQAYNRYGDDPSNLGNGNSLYAGSTPQGRAYKVSYNRPFDYLALLDANVFSAEYPMIRWLEANGYDVSYFGGLDTALRGEELREHRVFSSVGHDEYWSDAQRANVEAARDAGIHLAFFSGNEVFWKIRWEPSPVTGDLRTLVCYKETHANQDIDPSPTSWTGTWRDPRFSPPGDGGRPENALTGSLFTVNGFPQTVPMTVSAEFARLRFWRNTAVARLGGSQMATLRPGSLGWEFDEDVDNGFRPAGLFPLAATKVPVNLRLRDFGNNYGMGSAVHSPSMYRSTRGAWVFTSATIAWSWGLAGQWGSHGSFSNGYGVEPILQQATVNLLADMGVAPSTLDPRLVYSQLPVDSTRPASSILAPQNGNTLAVGRPVVIRGSASDSGGVVAAVEVSVDGGGTWHPATGRTTWSYRHVFRTPGSFVIRSRAVDDSGNIELNGPGVTVAASLPRAPVPDGLGVVATLSSNPNVEGWSLTSELTGTAPASISFRFEPQPRPSGASKVLACDWDGDGVDTATYFAEGEWFYRQENTTGYVDRSFAFGNGRMTPVCGDWDGDGRDGPGLYGPNGLWALRNSPTDGDADISFPFGTGGEPAVAGDWNGDGIDTVGVVQGPWWHLRNSNSAGNPSLSLGFQPAPGGIPVVGDWNGDGIDTPGMFINGRWILRHANTSDASGDTSRLFGDAGGKPIAGCWRSDTQEQIFLDVPPSHPFFVFINAIARHGITAGCGGGNYCPDASTTRAQMAIFLLRARYGSNYIPPPATGTVFRDVPATGFAAAWIEQLHREGITAGCGNGNYCPDEPVTRAQMAIFLLRTKEGGGYAPPPATGTVFGDVPATGFAAAWIEELFRRGITAGCGNGNYCPTSPVTRGQMAVFLARTFNLL